MHAILSALIAWISSTLRSRAAMQLEILALRHQLAIFKQAQERPRLRPGDRILWSWIARFWSGWQDVLIFVQPATVIAWQRRRFHDLGGDSLNPGSRGDQPSPKKCVTSSAGYR